MKINKITCLILLLLLQVAVKAQTTTVNYTYDASGNRQSRTFNIQPIAPPQNNNNNTVAADIQGILTADSLASASLSNQTPASLSNLSEGDIKVFPNPLQYKLNVQFKGTAEAEGCSMQIYDGAGRLFHKQDALQNHTEVDMQQANSGNYYLVIITKEGKRLYWKLVKQ
jgi:YD repeat-containing protein